jgi:hypothetical protein
VSWRQQTGQDAQEGGLPRSRGTQDSHKLLGKDRKRDIIQGMQPTIPIGENGGKVLDL